MNLLVMRAGFPPAVVKLSERDPYVAALRRADAGELERITGFVAQSVLDSESLYLRGANGESIEDADDVDKAVTLLKQELRAAPAIIELSQAVQTQHFQEHLIPFLHRLDAKVAMFDDLFAESSVGLRLGPGYAKMKRQAITGIIFNLRQQRDPIGSIAIDYRWDGFLKDGPNDFSANVGVEISYQQRKLQFVCRELGTSRMMIYGTWLSEDEIKAMVTDLTKNILSVIQRNLNQRKQA